MVSVVLRLQQVQPVEAKDLHDDAVWLALVQSSVMLRRYCYACSERYQTSLANQKCRNQSIYLFSFLYLYDEKFHLTKHIQHATDFG
jgi:hypothetical protein